MCIYIFLYVYIHGIIGGIWACRRMKANKKEEASEFIHVIVATAIISQIQVMHILEIASLYFQSHFMLPSIYNCSLSNCERRPLNQFPFWLNGFRRPKGDPGFEERMGPIFSFTETEKPKIIPCYT